MTTEKTIRFIKGYPKFAYLMSNEAVYFMMHMADIEFLRKGNYNTHRWFKGGICPQNEYESETIQQMCN